MRNLMWLIAAVLLLTLLCLYVNSTRGPALIDNPYVDANERSPGSDLRVSK